MQLTVEWLRHRCSAERPQIVVHEAPVATGSPVAAAVLIPIVNRPSGLTVLLTQRTAHLRDHAGQVCFPGGCCEPVDVSAVATALRESHEEVGIAPDQVEILANLPDYFTSTGYRITPVVGLVTPPLNLHLDDFEVAEVFEPPLEFLLDPASYHQHALERDGTIHQYWAVPWQGRFIWGATAGMLVTLRQCLFAQD
ncbi:MAG: CoA pyrophosphatase [Gammaproteobacteria bacterium]|nr:CoA pyrophosphatase [Rhodocyclaceae bacterium]MBU3909778.1 CoA pyrophosphatase [Gammaproteobacteria bacterium]MBU3990660.1 CoA pyrophosphatase [Gammaproteobacteria bacterium]MBU4005311.1 CoA pyrophosphatase [Gammaproteobacteria bacterium]MBU4022489.1 CoA pyrophosphatase [Gammaproteobacteria bacterium]